MLDTEERGQYLQHASQDSCLKWCFSVFYQTVIIACMDGCLTCIILSIEVPGNAAKVVLTSPASTQSMPNFLAMMRTIRRILRLAADLEGQLKHFKSLKSCQRLLPSIPGNFRLLKSCLGWRGDLTFQAQFCTCKITTLILRMDRGSAVLYTINCKLQTAMSTSMAGYTETEGLMYRHHCAAVFTGSTGRSDRRGDRL